MNFTAVVLGATGLVGEQVLQQLLEDDAFQKVIILTRRAMTYKHPKLENIVNDLTDVRSLLKNEKVDVLFSCLGTTRKKTPDLNQYRHIEISIPETIAYNLKSNGLSQIHYISAIGVKENSDNFYIKIKNEAEKAMSAVGVNALYIYRPSLIVGDRKDYRALEKLGAFLFKGLNFLMWGGMKKYRSVDGMKIAAKMIAQSKKPMPGQHIIHFP